MRELKFRVWDQKFKNFINGDLFFEQIEGAEENSQLRYSQVKLNAYHGYVIQQFTGLKDKNGVEIYEGDIVGFEIEVFGREETNLVIVEFDLGEFVGKWPDSPTECAIPMYIRGWYDLRKKPQVIGNIFENSDLLK